MTRKAAAPLMAALLSSCTLIPSYNRPALPVSASYPSTGGPANVTTASDVGWKDFFKDPALQQLIALSLENNRNLRVSVLDIEEAQGQYRLDRASLFPTLDAEGLGDVERTPANLSESGRAVTAHEYEAQGAVSWELDLFGKVRSQMESAHQTVLSDVDTAVSTRLSLIAQVASEYDTWLADRESLQISQNTAAADQHSLQLVQLELAHGTETAQDVAQAETTYDTAVASVAQYQRAVAQDMDELVLLAGAPIPDALQTQMLAVNGLDAEAPLPLVPAGLPSDLLTRRPDVLAAEHTLLAANANIGAARAAFFPSISITANGGQASNALNSLFAAGQGSWLFQPQITLPIFTGGENMANLDIARVEKRIEIANYEEVIQSAFHDVSDALNARQTYVDQVKAQTDLVAADQRYYDLSLMRFKAGIDTYLNVLVAQDDLLSAQLNLVTLKLDQNENEITLYKALGGGWQADSGPTPAPKIPG